LPRSAAAGSIAVEPDEETSMRRMLIAATLTLGLGVGASAAAGPPPKLTRALFREAQAIVMKAYPAPFQKTYAQVVEKLGKHHKGSEKENMFQWFAVDDGKCVVFFMTKDAKQGHAAAGIYDGNADDCKGGAK
jgi:hypothetical protein